MVKEVEVIVEKIVEKDKVIYAKGFGYSDYENKVPFYIKDDKLVFPKNKCYAYHIIIFEV